MKWPHLKFIEQPPLLYRILFPEAIWRIKRKKQKVVYLTFDDGPIPEVTPWVLDLLDYYNIKATFFLVGDNVKRNPHLLEEIKRRGHSWGNHTMNHLQGFKERSRVYLRNIKIDGDLDIELLARQTPGFSGADIANVCNEAALIAARHNKPAVTREDFSAAVDRIIGGIEKRSKITTDEEKRSIAIHEAGHATVSWHLRYANPLVKVTIVPRGKALGAAWYLPEERQITPSQVILDEICATLGGRAAEEVFLGRISTGAANDLERVTKQAYAMVVYYGMSDKLPNLSYYDSTGQDYGFTKPFSDERARIIDDEVSRIIAEQYERAKEILRRHADGHHRLTEVLINREVIFTQDVVDIFGERPWKSRTDEILAHDPRLLEAPKADDAATAPAPDAPEAQAADDGADTPADTPDNTPTPPPYTGA